MSNSKNTNISVGVVAYDYALGTSGGLAISTKSLVEALADYSERVRVTVLIRDGSKKHWGYREWPSFLKFVELKILRSDYSLFQKGFQTLVDRVAIRAVKKKSLLAKRIDGLSLDLIHFPATTIFPLDVETPIVLTFYDMQHEYYPQFFTSQELARRAENYRPSVDRAEALISPTLFTAETLKTKYGVDPQRISLIPTGRNSAFCRADAEQIAEIRRKYDLPDVFIFYPANPWLHKNHSRLIAALRLYESKYGNAPTLVCSGRLENESRDVRSLAIAADMDEKVIDLQFVGMEDMPMLYSAAEMLIYPSLFEGFGMPLVEAMATRCPIVASNATTIPEVAGSAGLYFDPLSPDDIAEKIHVMMTDSSVKRNQLACAVDQLNKFDWSNIIPELTKLYNDTIS